MKLNYKSGLIVSPTGTGKSFLILYITLNYVNLYRNDVVIMTKRKEIFYDFKNELECMMKKMNIINVKVIDCCKDEYDYNIFQKEEINKIFLINSDKFIASGKFNNYQKYCIGNVKLWIQDECHWCGGKKIYEFLRFVKTKVSHLIGFSATPTRLQPEKIQRTLDIYGDGISLNIIYQRNYIDAIQDGDIVETKWIVFNVLLNDIKKEKTNGYITYSLNENGINKVFSYIKILPSIFQKMIFWFKTERDLEYFYGVIKDNKKYNIYRTYYKGVNEIIKFKNEDKNAILLAIFRATEGFNDLKIDIGLRTYIGKNIDILLESQRMGLLLVAKKLIFIDMYI